MNVIQHFMSESFVQATGWTLLHFIWQGFLVAGFLFLTLQVLRSRSANSRYIVSCFALLFMLALPPVTLQTIRSSLSDSPASADSGIPTAVEAGKDSVHSSASIGPASYPSLPSVDDWSLGVVFSRVAPWMTAAWFAGVLLLSLRMFGGWLYTRRLTNHFVRPLADSFQQRFAELLREIRVSHPVLLLESALVQVPTAIGALRPVILVPASALTGLTTGQLESILLHELAHIRRHDYVINVMQTAVETLLFYHPAVWWVSRRIRIERENCCDDWAAGISGDRIAYARALTAMETLRSVTPRLAMAADGGCLLSRIQRLIAQPSEYGRTGSWFAVVLVITIAVMLSAGVSVPLFSNSNSKTESIPASTATTKPEQPEHPETVQTATSEQSTDEEETSPEVDTPGRSPGFLEEMAALEYANLTVDEIIALNDHGVTPKFVRQLAEHGYRKLAIPELIRLRDYDVSPKFIAKLAEAGVEGLTVDDLIRLQSHGVSASFVRNLNELGYKNLSVEDLIRAADHGVTPAFVRHFQSSGYSDLTIDDLVRARDHGVDPGFVHEVHTLGWDHLNMEQLVKLKDHGVTYPFMKELQSLGFAAGNIEEYIRARSHGVDPGYIREIRLLGYEQLTLNHYIRMRDHGVDASYIQSIRSAGYDDLPVDEIVRLRDHGIEATFLREAASRGFQNLSADQLIRLRDAGIFEQE